MQAPRAVLFDLVGTLLDLRHFDLEAGILAALGPDSALVAELARTFTAERAERHRSHLELSLAPWLVEQVAHLQESDLSSIEESLWPSVITLSPVQGAESVLRLLCENNVRVAVISNAAYSGQMLMADLDRHGLGAYVEFVPSSSDTGVRKPNPSIFESALQRLGVPVEDCWFVGDTYLDDVVGSASVGMRPFWLSDQEPPTSGPASAVQVRSWAEFEQAYRSAAGAPRAA